MENRNMQGRTLLPHQRKIWTEAFKASMHHTSIESAERKAWQAVDICERVGAFGDVSQTSVKQSTTQDYESAFAVLVGFFVFDDHVESMTIRNPTLLRDVMIDFQRGEIGCHHFKNVVASMDSMVEFD